MATEPKPIPPAVFQKRAGGKKLVMLHCVLFALYYCVNYMCVTLLCVYYHARYIVACITLLRLGYIVGFHVADIDDCVDVPCQNDGECLDRVNGYQCNCTALWAGDHCETLEGKTGYLPLSLVCVFVE